MTYFSQHDFDLSVERVRTDQGNVNGGAEFHGQIADQSSEFDCSVFCPLSSEQPATPPHTHTAKPPPSAAPTMTTQNLAAEKAHNDPENATR